MSTRSPSDDPASVPRNNVLEVPVATPPRFVLPPPPSELLSRLDAFLPRMKQANEELAQQQATAEGNITTSEGVELELLSSSSDSDSSEEEDSSDSDDDDSGEEDNTAGQDEAMHDDSEAAEPDTMSHLLNIGARPKIIRKKLVEMSDASDSPSQRMEDAAPAVPSD